MPWWYLTTGQGTSICWEQPDPSLLLYLYTKPKKYLPQEFHSILKKVHTMAQEIEPTDFFWTMEDLPSNCTLPAMELCLQNPKLPGQDTSYFSKLSWSCHFWQRVTQSPGLLGIISLHQVLLRYLLLSDGHQLITEVRQSNKIMGPVQAVIPNTPEAEQTIFTTNKTVPGYIKNVLKDQGMPESFLMDLAKNFCCLTQVSDITICTWDPDTGTLTIHQDTAEEKNTSYWKRHLGSKMHLPIWTQWLMGNWSSKPHLLRPCSPSKKTGLLKWSITIMSKQPLPHKDTHPHGRAKARLSTWQSLMKNPPRHLARIGCALRTIAAVGDKDSLTTSDKNDNKGTGSAIRGIPQGSGIIIKELPWLGEANRTRIYVDCSKGLH